jgi:hypothetical protein
MLLVISLNLMLIPGAEGESPVTGSLDANEPILFVINGESNSGGYALNSQASPHELQPRSSVRILNNATLASFDDLEIGVNNLVGHDRLTNGPTHGFELELANRADSSTDRYGAPCYLVKTGQGGSLIAEWTVKGAYFTTFSKRVKAARKLLQDQPHRTIVLFSLGINDAIAGTDVGTWQRAVVEHFVNLRREVGTDTPIIMTRFMRRYAPFNTAIEEICREVPNTYSVNTLDASLRDDNHWDYGGMARGAPWTSWMIARSRCSS